MTLLYSFDVLKLYLHGLSAKAAKVSVLQVWNKKKCVYRGGMLEEKNIFINSRHLRVSNSFTNVNCFAVNYCFDWTTVLVPVYKH